MSNKCATSKENIIIKAQKEEKIKVKGLENEIHINVNELIKHHKILAELFNNHLEKTSGLAPNCIGSLENPNLDKLTLLDIINKYKGNSSITKIQDLGINNT